MRDIYLGTWSDEKIAEADAEGWRKAVAALDDLDADIVVEPVSGEEFGIPERFVVWAVPKGKDNESQEG